MSLTWLSTSSLKVKGQNYLKVADGAARKVSKVYRCLNRMRCIVGTHGGDLQSRSRKIFLEIQALVESTEHHLRPGTDWAAQFLTIDKHGFEERAYPPWIKEYADKVIL